MSIIKKGNIQTAEEFFLPPGAQHVPPKIHNISHECLLGNGNNFLIKKYQLNIKSHHYSRSISTIKNP